jgi:hypothetical protein
VRKILFIFSLWLGVMTLATGAETLTLTLTDGGSVAGEIVKSDDNGVMLHTPGEVYTNIAWGRFSQDALKQLQLSAAAANSKINKAFIEPFIEPTAAEHPPKKEISPIEVKERLKLPEHPSIFSGLIHSSVGLFILLILYGANLFAAYEISIVKARSAGQVMGVAAVLPVIGPVIFLILPMHVEKAPEEELDEAGQAPGDVQKTPADIQIGEASWKPQEEKKPEPQIYTRGKFTFNKRFVETKFAAFVGAAQGDLAKKFTMEVKTMKEQFTVERIMQIEATEVIFETVQRGQMTVPLSDIMEVKLNPKTP